MPPLAGDRTADACVVGLGASGLAAVEALADRGLWVVGVDAGRVAAGASGRNGGFLLGGAAVYLHSAIALWGVDAAIGLYRETLAELDRLARQLGPGVVGRNGSTRLAGLPGEPVANAQAADCGAVDRGPADRGAADREAELADCAAHAAALRRGGIAVERYAGPLGEGLFLPDDAATNPARRALAVAGPLAGRANLHEHTPVVRIESGRVITAAGTVSAGVVVVAVDGRLELLLPQLAGRVRTARLQMLATAPVATDRLPCPVYGRWGYDYAQQDAAGRLFVGGGRDRFVDAEWTADASPTDEVQHHIERVAARLAGGPVTVTHRWAASAGYTPDGRPLVTEVADGVVACGGYSGTGNLVGPVAARAAVALALDGVEPSEYFTG